MSRSCPIALAGLSPTEQILIEGALFPPSGGPIPGARLEHDLARAQLIIASADDAAAVAALKARALPARVLLLGVSDRGTGWPLVLRPLRIHNLLEAVRRLLEAPRAAVAGDDEPATHAFGRSWLQRLTRAPTGFADTQPFTPVEPSREQDFAATRQFEPATATSPFEATQPLGALRATKDDFEATRQFAHSVPSVAPSDWENEVTEWEQVQAQRIFNAGPQGVAQPPAPSEPAGNVPSRPESVIRTEPPAQRQPTAMPDKPVRPEPSDGSEPAPAAAAAPLGAVSATRILVVGLPGNAARGLINTLQQAGFTVDFADNEQATFELMGRQAFQFVILIEVSLGPRAIALCRTIQGARGLSPADLRVVIIASHRGLLSRLRAQFAGCSAWLTIPLKQDALVRYLRMNGSGGGRNAGRA